MYLSYERYGELGGSIGPLDFDIKCREAERFVDRLTFCRVKADFELKDYVIVYKDDLEMLVFRLVEMNKASDITEQIVTSESNQGMSRSYAKATQEEVKIKSFNLVNEFLTGYKDNEGVKLLFRG